jgi:hypothetical protein
VNVVSELHHAMQKLRPPATALRAIIHLHCCVLPLLASM